ncbi:hypothetical protein Syun_031027 [Stephania yunnanensis]|uniref:Uncharacterized protein n=1 Tax=Stephania yunnanensis TaxID=152371 RepID=A0AAP0HEL5_9MAGN
MTPVLICKETLTTTVTTMTVKEAMVAENSDSFMLTMEVLKMPIEMQIKAVPHSFDSWS